MNLLEQSDSRLVYQEPPLPKVGVLVRILAIPCVLAFFFGLPSYILFTTVYGAGTGILKCARLETTNVSCEYSQTHLFGFLKKPSQQIGQITKVMVIDEPNPNGRQRIEPIQMPYGNSPSGELKPLGFQLLGRRLNDEPVSNSQIQVIAGEVNQFIQTPSAQTLTITRGNRFSLNTFMGLLGPLFFITLGLALITEDRRVGQLELDKYQRRLRVKSISQRREPKILRDLSFDAIENVAVVEYQDDDGDKHFKAVIQVHHANSITVMYGYEQSVLVVQTLRNFLGLPDQDEPISEHTET